MRVKLFWKLFLGNAVLVTVMLVACVRLITWEVDRFYQAELTMSLRSQAEALAHLLSDRFDPGHAVELQHLADEIGRNDPAGVRITLIALNGVVLADSMANPAVMELHHTRGEFRRAIATGWGEESRRSATLGRLMKYVAVRVGPAEAPLGVARVAMPQRNIADRADSIRQLLWSTAAIAIVASLVFALGLAALWSVPIRRITLTARNLSRGDLSARVHVLGDDELAGLGKSLNEMRDSLVEQMKLVDSQRSLLASLLAHLRDSVIVVGTDGRVVLMNLAAHQLLGLIDASGQPLPVEGNPVRNCVAQSQLRQLLLEQNTENEPVTQQIRLESRESGDITLLATTSNIMLPGIQEDRPVQATGRLLVLTDVSPLARMIQVKADFAANASHELRTPLSAIRAAVETLEAIDACSEPEHYRRFLNIIERHTNRMEAMVVDLLNLSRIESATAQFKRITIDMPELLADLHERVATKLEAKNLQWRTHLPDGQAQVSANPHLLHLILENLVENAIKFTDPGGRIDIVCERHTDRPGKPVTIRVVDNGCGIPAEDQERVFERFYQVERARSGAERGTGLGLSIVRHAVAAMGGTVELTSRLGEGTTVTITLPQEE